MYNQAPFPNTASGAGGAYPNVAASFPSDSYASHTSMGWQQQQQQPSPPDLSFYNPQTAQPSSQSPPQAHAGGWGQSSGPRMRPAPAVTPGGSVDPTTVAFMPQQAAQLMANPMAGMALDYGKASLAKNLSWVMSFLSALKYYFHVNNRYVVAKLKVLLLPFLHSNWKRERLDAGAHMQAAEDASVMSGLVGAPIYKAPRDDINAPDLYIPTMAFVTFTLAMGYALGIGNQFHPEVLGLTASRNLILLFFEVLGLKGGLYLISVGPYTPTSLLDLVSYASYKYIHCILMIIVGLLFGSWCFYASILLLGTCAALFMMRTMKRVCTPAPSVQEQNAALAGGYDIGTGRGNFGQGKHRRNYFLLIIGGVQILFSWFLVRTANAGF